MQNRFTTLPWVICLLLSIFSFKNAFSQDCTLSNPYFVFSPPVSDELVAATNTCTAVFMYSNHLPVVNESDRCGVDVPRCDVNMFDEDLALTGLTDGQVVPVGTTLTIYYTFQGEIDSIGQTWSVLDTFCFDIRVVDEVDPVFTTTKRPDTLVACITDIPAPDTLLATDDCDLTFMGAKKIVPVDNYNADFCNMQVMMREWTVTDASGNSVTVTRNFVIADDSMEPTLNFVDAMTEDTLFINCQMPMPDTPAVVAMDNCEAGIPVYTEISTQVNDGSCGQFQYEVLRRWTVSDTCMNMDTLLQWVIVADTTRPTITTPKDTIINCSQGILPATTGQMIAMDLCDPTPSINFVDAFDTLTCINNVRITRTWTVSDACGNMQIATQLVTVQDTTKPTFIVPKDTTVNCGFTDTNFTGVPTNVADDCDADPNLTFSDTQAAGACAGQFTITREWRLEDTCGNVLIQNQIINSIDTIAPMITTEAKDTIYDCSGTSANTAFSNWVMTNGGAEATDNCNGTLNWVAFNTGTNTQAALPILNCGSSNIVRSRTVDFIVFDPCGKSDTTSATFTERDTIAPMIDVCHPDVTADNDPGQCGATLNFQPPRFVDDCHDLVQTFATTTTEPIRSAGAFGDQDVPVNPINFDLNFGIQTLSITSTSVDLVVELNNVDGEIDTTEFFNVFDEDGMLLGRTMETDTQCGTSTTTFTITDLNKIYAWLTDGIIEMRLEPNIPTTQAGRFAINNICPNASVTISTSFDAKLVDNTIFEYSLNGDARNLVSPVAAFAEFIPVGSHVMTYYITDCGGNVDSCSFAVAVADVEAPQLTCPANMSANTDTGECDTDVTLQLPIGATDNCGLPGGYVRTQPIRASDRLITFMEDPNLNDFLAQDKTINFTSISGNASGGAGVLRVFFQGDFDATDGYFTVIGEDGTTVLGTTNTNVTTAADCNTVGTAMIPITDAQINAWGADGVLSITFVSNINIPIPPGGPGSGINPCGTSVTTNGQSDGTSQIWAELSFEQLTPTYYTTGATVIANTMQTVNHDPTHTFNVGTTDVFYIIEDIHGNIDTCTYELEVVDNEPPVANCLPSVIRINPSGTVTGTISPLDIGANSTDNCGIPNMTVVPSTVGCALIGQTVDVDLIVEDFQGNKDTCTTFVRIEGEEANPSFLFECGSDTLFLFANPPTSSSANSYTYRWFGPSGALISTDQDPIITTPSLIQAGSYCIEIEGLTGCISTSCISIPLELNPTQPTISGPSLVCWDSDDITLNTTPPPGFTGTISYNWYFGNFPTGTLIGSTITPSFSIPAPHNIALNTEETRNFYLTISINGCESKPSNILPVDVVRPPNATVTTPVINLCENETLQLSTDDLGVDYAWTGPSSNANTQNPVITNDADPTIHSGNYTLEVGLRGCFSPPATTVVNVFDVPDGKPNLTPVTQEICVGNDFTLSTNLTGVSSYMWIPPIGPEIPSPRPTLTLTATVDHDGPWQVYGVQTYSNQSLVCATEVSDPVLVNVNTFSEPLLAAVQPNPVCEGSDIELQVSPVLANATYQWIDPEGASVGAAAVITLPSILEDDEGIYRVRVTNSAGCVKEELVPVFVTQGVEIIAVSNNAPNCFTGPTDVELSVVTVPQDDGTFTYSWTGPGPFLSGDSLATVNIVDFDNSLGAYFVEVINGDGCISNVGSTVVDGQAPLAPPTVTRTPNEFKFCEGDDLSLTATMYQGQTVTYNWFTPQLGVRSVTNNPNLDLLGMSGFDSGFYIVQAEVDGCPTVASAPVSVEVNPIPAAFPSVIEPCEGGALEFSGLYFPAGGSDVDFEWTTPQNTQLGAQNPTIQNANPADHNGLWTFKVIRDGCVSDIRNLTVEITEAPFLPAPLPNDPICLGSGDPLMLCVDPASAETGATYTWTDVNGDTLGTSTNLCLPITDLSGYSAGDEVFFVATTKDGCTAENTTPHVVTFSDLPNQTAAAGSDFTVCDDTPLMLTANAPAIGTGTWTYLGGLSSVMIDDPNAATTMVTGLPPGNTYQFEWAYSNGGCARYSIDTVAVTIYAQENAFAGVDIDTCNTTTFRLNALPSLSGLGFWEQSMVQTQLNVVIADINDPNTLVTVPGPSPNYFFTWVIPDQVCGGDRDEVKVRVASPTAFAGMDTIACGLGDFQLNATPSASTIGEWTALNSDIEFSDVTDPMAEVFNLENGSNSLIWTIDNGLCGPGSIDTIDVFYNLSPFATRDVVVVPFGGSQQFEPGLNDPFGMDGIVTIALPPSRGAVQNNNDGTLVYSSALAFVGLDSMVYQICPVDATCGCTQATVLFEVGLAIEGCEVPDIITPNGDGMNDFLSIGCVDETLARFPNNELTIYNQWGDEVYNSSPYRNDWAGTYKNDDLPVGTYFYILELGVGSDPISGFITIHR